MNTGIIFIVITAILIFVFVYNKVIDTNKFIEETEPYFRSLMEDDYRFLLLISYGHDVDANKMFGIRVRNGIIVIVAMIFIFLNKMSFIYFLISIIAGFLVFKMPHSTLKKNYKSKLHKIDLLLPYYLKSLEVLIQHYTVPVALRRSIDTAPEIFKPGLRKLCAKIEAGDSSVEPYMDFAKEYPVRDSMRMMRLLYRLGLGSQEKKDEQLMMFSRTVSSLQSKAREQKYKERLEKMEQKTLIMLFCTGGGVLVLMLLAMMMLMNI